MTHDPRDLLTRLEDHAAKDPAFTPDELRVLRDVIEAYRSWSVLGRATKWVVLILAGISGLVVSLANLGSVIKSWLAP